MSKIQLIGLTILALIAFAANSVLTRMAVSEGVGPIAFAAVRLLSGALVLLAFSGLKGKMPPLMAPNRFLAVFALCLYMCGFSLAYIGLPSGVGALILFAVVQITMFGGAIVSREEMPIWRWLGAFVALAGLAYFLYPREGFSLPLSASLFMILAGIGWGIYSLLGRGSTHPLADTAYNFLFACVPVGLLWLLVRDGMNLQGFLLGIFAGALTSGVGYAIWYAVLPALGASRASVSQLSVPILATLGGVIWLSEPITWPLIVSTCLVVFGVALSLVRR